MSGSHSRGQITSGIKPDAAARKTLQFIEDHLADWRDDPERPDVEQERELNSKLCKFLDIAARKSDFSMATFHHEEPQGKQHAVDISASPTDGGLIEGKGYTKYDPILVVECKRLPTPGSGRKQEYVSSLEGKKSGGGIQRFKLGFHGQKHRIAGMIGYVQAKTCSHWFTEVNHWVDELASSPDSIWTSNDRLSSFTHDPDSRVARCESEHSRESSESPVIQLTHLWVQMHDKTPQKECV